MLDKLDYLAAAPGVLAVSIDFRTNDDQRAQATRGIESWRPVLAQAIVLRAAAGEASLTIVTGIFTIIVQQHATSVAAVVIPTGHAVAKSIRRMLRFAAGLVRAKAQQPAAVTAPPPPDPASIPDEALPSSIPW